jgi:molybdopterin molybdotransferase
MLTPAEADAAIVAALAQMPAEQIPLAACAGRILRQRVEAERDLPPFDRVTMDGIAIAHGGSTAPRSYGVAATAAAGAPPLQLDSTADCIEVMTGAVLPTACDTVVPVEKLRIADGRATIDESYEPEPGRFIHRRGSDARAGELLLDGGVRLGPPELAIAASAGQAQLSVSRLPRIAVVTTGDELVEPGQAIRDHEVRRSNAYGLAAALGLAGFPAALDLHLPDDAARVASSLARALESHDVLVISGGVSAGRFDFVPGALIALGARKIFHGVAQRPGRPLWFGIGPRGQAIFALPGNPVSVLVCLARYVRPALRQMIAETARSRPKVALSRDQAFDAPLTWFLPVRLRYDQEGEAAAEPRPTGGSGDFVSLAGTEGFVELPPGPRVHRAGTRLPFYRW